MADTFLPIPSLEYHYEIDIHGNVRNAKTKHAVNTSAKYRVPAFRFIVNGKETGRTLASLLHEVHGIIIKHHNCEPVGVTFRKGKRVYYFNSMLKGAKFMANIIGYSFGNLRYVFFKRKTEICGWKIQYHEPQKPIFLPVCQILRR